MADQVMLLESLQQEISSMAQQSLNDGRKYLNDLELEHLIKMMNDVVMKIKQQTMEMTQ